MYGTYCSIKSVDFEWSKLSSIVWGALSNQLKDLRQKVEVPGRRASEMSCNITSALSPDFPGLPCGYQPPWSQPASSLKAIILFLSVSLLTHTHTHTHTHARTHTIASVENFDWYKWLQIHKEKRDTVLRLEIQKLETHIFAEILLVGIREKRKQAWILHLGMMPFPEMGRGRDVSCGSGVTGGQCEG